MAQHAIPALPVPRWIPALTLVLTVAGIGVATYLTLEHFNPGAVKLSCPENSTINCAKVTDSAESTFLGAPVALLGLIYFVVLLPLFVPAAWRSRSRLVRSARVLAVIGGIGFVLWLVYAELVKIKAICLYCTSVHVITFLLFVLTLVGTALTAAPDEEFEEFEDFADEEPADVNRAD